MRFSGLPAPQYPAPLQTGDRVRLVSPASPPDEASVRWMQDTLQSWGLVVELGDHVLHRTGFLAGTDEQRLSDLNSALRDPGIRAIIATRGGKGSYRIADKLDFDTAHADPKFLVGFSDITILQMSLWQRCGVMAIHGGLLDNDTSLASLRHAMMTDEPMTAETRSDELSAALTTAGTARGPLLGGNLRMMATAAGWCLPKLDGAILLVEIVDLFIGDIDRKLTMLRKAGHLAGLAGVAFGQITNCAPKVLEVIREHLDALDVPVLGGLPLGHGNNPKATLLGGDAEFDVSTARLIVRRPAARPGRSGAVA